MIMYVVDRPSPSVVERQGGLWTTAEASGRPTADSGHDDRGAGRRGVRAGRGAVRPGRCGGRGGRPAGRVGAGGRAAPTGGRGVPRVPPHRRPGAGGRIGLAGPHGRRRRRFVATAGRVAARPPRSGGSPVTVLPLPVPLAPPPGDL